MFDNVDNPVHHGSETVSTIGGASMHVRVNKTRAVELLDDLLGRYTDKKFPYNLKRAVVPQVLIPASLREDKETLARFYFFACLYMRGRIESHTAFRGLIRMWHDQPDVFDPACVQHKEYDKMVALLLKYMNKDVRATARHWLKNAGRLVRYWDSSVLNVLSRVKNYDDALYYIRNKHGKHPYKNLLDYEQKWEGFVGFQHKMVSMLIYFFDWEGWLKQRFIYPSPADFHHYRIFLATGVLVVSNGEKHIRYNDRISAAIRRVVFSFIKSKKADPVEVADTLWLFSYLLCGESPVTATPNMETRAKRAADDPQEELFPNTWKFDLEGFVRARSHRYWQTCGICPVRENCTFAVPARLYYDRGIIELRQRPLLGEVVCHSTREKPAKSTEKPLPRLLP